MIEFSQPVCIDDKPHSRHLIAGTWRDYCPGRTTQEAQIAAAEAPAHVRTDCPALPVGCERCTAPATVRAALMSYPPESLEIDMQEGTHDPIGRLGADHPIINVTYDYVLGCGAATRADAAHVLDNMPAGYGTLTADERAAVLDRFNS